MILYQGPSKIDGSPIVAIATTGSRNVKTGDMLQTWILRADIDPITAARDGRDASICGTCPHRGPERSCYVNLGHAPLAVYRAYRRGAYRVAEPAEAGRGRAVRIGSYGDPLAVPAKVWRDLLRHAATHTGYTHGKGATPRYLMRSADSLAEAQSHWEKGARTFRVLAPGEDSAAGEIICPNTTHGVQCADCKLCGGAMVRAPSIAIHAHGAGKKYIPIAASS